MCAVAALAVLLLLRAAAGVPAQETGPLVQVETSGGFSLVRMADYPERALGQLEERLGAGITRGRAYLFAAGGEQLRVNMLAAPNAAAAGTLGASLTEMRSPQFVGRAGRYVFEYATADAARAADARDHITFRPTGCAALGEDRLHAYLSRWSQSIDPDEPQRMNLAGLIPEAGARRLYVAGEQHGIAENQALEFAFLTQLHRRAGVRLYFQELPYSASLLLDRYLQTGQEQALERAFRGFTGTYSDSRELVRLYRRLRSYNDGLEPAERIRVVGFDIEHQPRTAFAVAADLVGDRRAPDPHDGLFDRLRETAARADVATGAVTAETYRTLAGRTAQAIAGNRGRFGELLGAERSFELELIMSNVVNLFEARAAQQNGEWNRVRDRMMYENALALLERLPGDESLFGQWGLNHVFQDEEFGVDWLAARLACDPASPLAGRVVSIAYAYEDAQQMGKGSRPPQPLTTYRPDPGTMTCVAKTQYTLFRLDAPESPYASQLRWMHATPRPTGGVTTDYFQYVVLIRDGTAARARERNN